MRVVYFIFNNTSGLGGHYRSLRTLCENWNVDYSVSWSVIIFGKVISPVLSPLKDVQFIRSTILLLPELFKAIIYVKRNKVDIIHCYDSTSFLIGRIVSFVTKTPVLFTKCGGKNEMYIPKSVFTILFSFENYYFLLNENRKKSNYRVISNRIDLPQFDQNILDFKEVSSNSKKVLRIGNIVDTYRKSIECSFEFTLALNKKSNNDNVLIIVGKKFDNTLESVANEYANVNYLWLGDIKYTEEASKLLFIADYVIGTGRGAMEGIGLGKTVYVSTEGNRLPIKVSSGNFEEFLRYNFSERSLTTNSTDENDYFSQINDPNLLSFFNQYCLARKANIEVSKLYEDVLKKGVANSILFPKDLLVNYIRYVRTNMPFREKLKFIIK